jgi:hypothetical protein
VYESSLAREERQQKRLVVVIVILIVLLFITNAVWVYFWNQYDYVDDYSVDVNSQGGIANYIGNDGDINNGTDNSSKDKNSGAS